MITGMARSSPGGGSRLGRMGEDSPQSIPHALGVVSLPVFPLSDQLPLSDQPGASMEPVRHRPRFASSSCVINAAIRSPYGVGSGMAAFGSVSDSVLMADFTAWRSSSDSVRLRAQKLGADRCFRVNCRAMDLVEMLRRPEGKDREFKRDLSSPARVLRTVVAFANTTGGTILIGVEDRNRARPWG